ncbi:uncharacterized protein MKZ38_003861 [Zalerion maritima]|uniref:LCCL domain-containing protein n=1 Tax=Zalerion maritima TaxID=339359 RepID=A0AAD5RMX9_9PEZI|nr:uncharacterized protein MKZ38_003861 [Zalerion maritima]
MPADHGESEPLLDDIEHQNNTFHPDAPLEDDMRPQQDQRQTNRSSLEMSDNSDNLPPPRKGWAKLVNKIPPPVRKAWNFVAEWSRGPEDARPHQIRPILPQIQELPVRLLDQFVPKRKHRILLYIIYCGIWFMTFSLMFRRSTFASEIKGWGVPQNLGCGDAYWVSGNKCGLDGNLCRPFNGSGFAFKCPASCKRYEVLNPRAVGATELIYQPLIVGGPEDDSDATPVYRGDSFICQAAIHSSIIKDEKGGCGIVQLVGQSQDYIGSKRHGLESVGFDSYFPLSYTFLEDVECDAKDLRWEMLGVDLAFMVVLSLFTASPKVFYFTSIVAMYWHVGMASDPPPYRSVAYLLEKLIGRFLPGMFIAWVMYDRMGVKRALTGLTAHVEKTFFWLGAFWVGALTNYTFDKIPIARLTPHDINQQPGAKAALAMIITIVICFVLAQSWYFRQEGRFIKYIRYYAFICAVLIIFILLPNLNLRIHHYFLALLLLPGTSMQTRLSLTLQGLLVGFYINGVARWGFDSILQTSYSLQGDAVHNSPLPVVLDPTVSLEGNVSSITFEWMAPPGPRYDGISILINDVERFRSYFDEGNDYTFTWERESSITLPEYFRFGYMEGTTTWDYTKAGIWDEYGRWADMPPGPSKVKRNWEESDELPVHRR